MPQEFSWLFLQVLKEDESRLAYDKQLKHAQQLLDVPIWETVECGNLNSSEEEGFLVHACRCGGAYRVAIPDLAGQSRIILPCDTCSLYLEVLNGDL